MQNDARSIYVVYLWELYETCKETDKVLGRFCQTWVVLADMEQAEKGDVAGSKISAASNACGF